ncbi:MAG: SecD/SecF family protein translocase subunit, partial [Armatimonadota bacterium]
VENRTVSATLGQDSITRSLNAALLGFIAVLIFMVAYYRLPGLLADFALLLYVALVVAVTAYAEVTLTLPGIAGLILTLGTAVDANIIIFERLKEELWERKTLRSAVSAGFDRAWTAILDANVTTLLAAAVLYWLGTSLIKGFAIMLFIGVICSLFTAVTVTRWLLTMVAETRWAQKRSLYGVGERSEEAEETQMA